MNSSEFKIKGGPELLDFLTKFPVEMERRILRGGLAAGAKPIQEEAKRLAPNDTGALMKGISVITGNRPNEVFASINLQGDHSFLGIFYEYGVKAHMVPKNGFQVTMPIGGGRFRVGPFDHPGYPARPFMRPALDTKAGEAIAAMSNYISNSLKIGDIKAPNLEVSQ